VYKGLLWPSWGSGEDKDSTSTHTHTFIYMHAQTCTNTHTLGFHVLCGLYIDLQDFKLYKLLLLH